MWKNQRPYNNVGLDGVEKGHMVGLGVWVLHMHYAQSSKIVNFHVSLGCLTKKLLCTQKRLFANGRWKNNKPA